MIDPKLRTYQILFGRLVPRERFRIVGYSARTLSR